MENKKIVVKSKLEQFTSKEPSKWLEKAVWREQNVGWLDRSFLIALKILSTLRENKKSQTWLADKLNVTPQQVSKIIKGAENLTLETINNIENALGIPLMEIPGFTHREKNKNI